MPQVIGPAMGYISGAFAASAAGTATFWQAVTVFAVKTAATMAVSYGVQRAFGKDPGATAAMQGRTMNYTQTLQPRVDVYGQVRVGGQMLIVGEAGDENEFLHVCIIHAAHECQALGDCYVNGEVVSFSGSGATGKYADHLDKWDHLGTDSQLASAQLTAAFPDKWTADHRGRGLAYTHFQLKWDATAKVFPSGLPVFSRVVQGRKVYDPRTETSYWTANAALCLADYISRVYGRSYATDFDLPSLIAAANLCDEDVALSGGGTEKRYEINGTVGADEDPAEVVGRMRDAMAGFCAEIGGKWVIHAGGYRAPSLSLSEADFISGIDLEPKVPWADGGNRVRGTFSNGEERYIPMEFPPVVNATYLAEDNGIERWLDLDLRFTTSATMAQRIAKIALERARQQISVTARFRVSALKAKAGDTAELSFAKYGWTDKEFDLAGHKFVVIDGAGGPALGVELALRETAAGVWDWASGEETALDLAPNTDLPDPWTVAAPTWSTIESGTEHLAIGADGTVRSRIWATWTEPADAYVQEYEIELGVGYPGGEDWWPVAKATRGTTGLYIADVIDDLQYLLRIRSVNGLGIRSDWEGTSHIVVGKTEPPNDPTPITVPVEIDGNARVMRWTNPTDKDLRGVEVWKGTSSTFGSGSTQKIGETRSEYWRDENAAYPWLVEPYYFIRSVDTTGNVGDAVDFQPSGS